MVVAHPSSPTYVKAALGVFAPEFIELSRKRERAERIFQLLHFLVGDVIDKDSVPCGKLKII